MKTGNMPFLPGKPDKGDSPGINYRTVVCLGDCWIGWLSQPVSKPALETDAVRSAGFPKAGFLG